MTAEITGDAHGVMTARISGTLGYAEMTALQHATAESIRRNGKVRVLIVVENFAGWEKAGDWGDLSFQEKYDPHIEKMAIVGDRKWQDLALIFVSQGLRAFPIEYFETGHLAAARAWIAQG